MSAGIDLQLLGVLCAIVETRSVSRAAGLLDMTQRAASYLLGRLRDQLGDPHDAAVAYSCNLSGSSHGLDILDSALKLPVKGPYP